MDKNIRYCSQGFDSQQPEQTSVHAWCKSMPAKFLKGVRMNDYIKREDAVEKIKADCDRLNHVPKRVVDFFTLGMESVPSADVAPVRHSAWKEVLAGMDYEYECTRCKACVEQEYPYCPNCGAKMDEWEEPVAEDFDYWEESGAADAYADHQR